MPIFSRLSAALVLFLVGVFTGFAYADTHYVDPGGSNTPPYTTPATAAHAIGDALTEAVDGDTVLVADGVYMESIVIAENLTVLSVNGAATTIIEYNDMNVPVVDINTAPQVTFGAPDQGFTVRQLAANAAVSVEGAAVGPDTVIIQDNIFEGDEADEGILVTTAIQGGHLVIQNNQFRKTGAGSFSFADAIKIQGSIVGSLGSVAALSGIVDLLNNEIEDFDFAGILFNNDIVGTAVTINPSTLTPSAAGGGNQAIYFSGGVGDNSNVVIDGTEIVNADTGIYFEGDVANASTVQISGVSISAFNDIGIYFQRRIQNDCDVSITECTIEGNGVANQDAILVSNGVLAGSSVTIADNDISGFIEDGIQINGVSDASRVSATGNTITGGASDTGFSFGVISGASNVALSDNTVSDFKVYGLIATEVDGESTLIIEENTFNAVAADGFEGVHIADGVANGSTAAIHSNNVTGFTKIGLSVGEVDHVARLEITGNTLTTEGALDGIRIGGNGVDDRSTALINLNTISGFGRDGMFVQDVSDGAVLEVDENNLTARPAGADNGLIIPDGVDAGATAFITNNSITMMRTTGNPSTNFVFIGAVDESAMFMLENRFEAPGEGMANGLYVRDGIRDSVAAINDNEIIGVRDYPNDGPTEGRGFYIFRLDHNSLVDVCRNTVVGDPQIGVSRGLVVYGAGFGASLRNADDLRICDNQFSNFLLDGIFLESDITNGSVLSIECNTLTGHPDGAQDGIDVDGFVRNGSILEVISNDISSVGNVSPSEDSAIEIHEIATRGGNIVHIAGNTLVGNASAGNDAEYGVFVDDGIEASLLSIRNNDISGFSEANIRIFAGVCCATVLDILGNDLNGISASRGIHIDGPVSSAAAVTISGNNIAGFDREGIKFEDLVRNSDILIEGNRIVGVGADGFDYDDGIDFNGAVDGSSVVRILSNIISDVDDAGLELDMLLDTATMAANLNDFSGTTTGIENQNSDADHPIEAANNWWGDPAGPNAGGAGTVGEVSAPTSLVELPAAPAPEFGAPYDPDGDGVAFCDDACPDTAEGATVDADGCSCLQLDDSDDDGDSVPNCDDACPSDPNKVEPGACGCGIPDTDSDGDGVLDCNDLCPNLGGNVNALGCPSAITPTPGPQTQPTDGGSDNGAPDCGAGLCGVGSVGVLPFMLLGLGMMRVRFRRAAAR